MGYIKGVSKYCDNWRDALNELQVEVRRLREENKELREQNKKAETIIGMLTDALTESCGGEKDG